jgi:hypothetical protein
VVASNCVGLRHFPIHLLVWHWVDKRSRKKSQPTFSGPHRVVQKISDAQYVITSEHTSAPAKFKTVALNNLKRCVLPSTAGWTLNHKYFLEAANQLGTKTDLLVHISYDHLPEDILDIMSNQNKLPEGYIILPDIPCLPWYGAFMNLQPHQKVRLPQCADLFLDSSSAPVGEMPWEHFLCFLQQ